MMSTEVAHAFVEAINSGDADRLSKWMTEDHTFVDSDGSEHSGREAMRLGWKEHLSMIPDFKIHVKDTFSRDNTVALLGIAEGTFIQDGVLKPENHWTVPAAWRVIVEKERVALWQLYVNPERMVAIFNRIEAAREDRSS
jgi:hypothetical protein